MTFFVLLWAFVTSARCTYTPPFKKANKERHPHTANRGKQNGATQVCARTDALELSLFRDKRHKNNQRRRKKKNAELTKVAGVIQVHMTFLPEGCHTTRVLLSVKCVKQENLDATSNKRAKPGPTQMSTAVNSSCDTGKTDILWRERPESRNPLGETALRNPRSTFHAMRFIFVRRFLRRISVSLPACLLFVCLLSVLSPFDSESRVNNSNEKKNLPAFAE